MRLLKRHGIIYKVHVSNFEEKIKHSIPKQLVIHNACGKAYSVAKHYQNAIVIGVDTLGFYKNKIIGKPKNRADAKRMLRMLSGKTHRVISGLCMINTKTGKKFTASVTTKVTFRTIELEELKHYLDSNQWKGKAGAYAIQGRAKSFVEKIDGDITNVIGVPMVVLRRLLEKIQILNV